MVIFEWNDSLSLNIPMIDEQHKELIGWGNDLYDAVQRGEEAKVIGEVLSNLISYVFKHFSEEERLMLAHSFPGFTSHRQEHDAFVSKLKSIQEGFQDGQEISRETMEFMADWIVCHIRGTDQKYGRFIVPRMGKQSSD